MNAANTGSRTDAVWLIAIGIASSIWILSAEMRLSSTWDEPTYLYQGLSYWHTKNTACATGMGTMPLPPVLLTAPLYAWEKWRGLGFDIVNHKDQLIPWMRPVNLLFWWLVLFYGFRIGRALGGPWGGRFAAVLLACEPTLLGHAGLATTDLCLSACLVAWTYHYATSRQAGWTRRVVLPGVWLGAALLAKLSAIIYVPMCMLAIELQRSASAWIEERRACEARIDAARSTRRAIARRVWRIVFDAGQILALGLILATICCAHRGKENPDLRALAQEMHEGKLRALTLWTADHLPIGHLVRAFQFQRDHSSRGHGSASYFLGRDAQPYWYYFPLMLCFKLGLPLMLLGLWLFLTRPGTCWTWPSVTALGMLLASMTSRLQLGVRLVLPVIALGIVGLAVSWVRSCPVAGPRRRIHQGLAVAAAVWLYAALLGVWPHALCYTNELGGGTRLGYRVFTDSNYDWGQGLKDLAKWQRKHELNRLLVVYFGNPAPRSGMEYVPTADIVTLSEEQMQQRIRGQYLAVSTTWLYGSGRIRSLEFLRNCQPIDRTQTFFIFDFTDRGTTSSAGSHVPAG